MRLEILGTHSLLLMLFCREKLGGNEVYTFFGRFKAGRQRIEQKTAKNRKIELEKNIPLLFFVFFQKIMLINFFYLLLPRN